MTNLTKRDIELALYFNKSDKPTVNTIADIVIPNLSKEAQALSDCIDSFPKGYENIQIELIKEKMVIDQDTKKPDGGEFRAWLEKDADLTIYMHRSSNPKPFTIKSENPNSLGGPDFGGIFVGPEGGMGGEFKHLVLVDKNKIASNYDLTYLHSEDIDKILKRKAPSLSNDEYELLYDFVTEKDTIQNYKDHLSDEEIEDFDIFLDYIFYTTDPGEVDWELQRVRGEIAKELGYQGVEGEDETGTSILVFPGVKTEMVKDGETYRNAESRLYEEWDEWGKSSPNQSRTPDTGVQKSTPQFQTVDKSKKKAIE